MVITNSRFHPASSKGVSSQLSLLTIILPEQLDWDEFETMPEELHLTNVAFEVFQFKDSDLDHFVAEFKARKDLKDRSYDVRGLLSLNFDKIDQSFVSKFDFHVNANFEDGIDIGIIEELRFQIANYI